MVAPDPALGGHQMSPEALRALLREASEKVPPTLAADYGCTCGGCTWCLLCMTYGDPMPVPQQKAGRR
jgi:hypothetical protein